jgi:hypothetical protein
MIEETISSLGSIDTDKYKMSQAANDIQNSIAKAVEYAGAVVEEAPTPECFPHQGDSLFIDFPDLHEGGESSLHVSSSGRSSVVITISKDIIVPADISMNEVQMIADFISHISYHNVFAEEDSE